MKFVKENLRIFLICFITLILIGVTILFVLYKGILLFNNPSRIIYPLHGVDVSVYQGNIDWNELSENDISFAFIKATEGSSFVDSKIEYNLSEALKTNLYVGAYHFFSYDSSGKTQAENFIKNVPYQKGMLPPVIDIEFYADKARNPHTKAEVDQILNDMLSSLEDYYNVKPILYVTRLSYDLYIKDDYKDYPIWVRSVYTSPSYLETHNWTFWQYSNRAQLKGYTGDQKFIDLNVFYGSKEDIQNLLIK